MALIRCPECNREISEYAIQCGFCFYPLKQKSVIDSPAATPKQRIRNGKPSRNGNGAGSITQDNGNLRKPFRVVVTSMIEQSLAMMKLKSYGKRFLMMNTCKSLLY